VTTEFGTITFIVWRECVEALLVIGILHAWTAQRGLVDKTRARIFLWSGVTAGTATAILLAVVLIGFSHLISGTAQQLWQTLLELVAAGLILQMLFWMRRHGRTLKRDIEAGLSEQASDGHWWGVFTLALVAVAREGSEAVVFVYGTLASAQSGSSLARALAIAAGAAAAAATFAALQYGGRLMSWRHFFNVSGILLMCLAGSLLTTAVDNLEALEYLPELSGRLWDTSHILPDTGIFGGLLSAMTGYRSRPDLLEVIVLAAYWISITVLFRQPAPMSPRAQ
jgi:high-affinity iron transporter